MIVSQDLKIDVEGQAMPAYLARPADEGRYPAVIVLEGVYGFDEELR
ncbi:MAG: dienelactone hydrolase family protein, partial [Candidatus Eremiobacteraeota bacterium]|nr:dienelactone hydrolase family protein [Candidatus Eremiobacteraeota bacterium]